MGRSLVALPETSVNSMLISMPYLWASGNLRYDDTIILDLDDYLRTRRLATTSRMYLAAYISLNFLIKYELFKILDYKQSYSNDLKKHNTAISNVFTKSLDDDKKQDLSLQGYEAWIRYSRSKEHENLHKMVGSDSLGDFKESKKDAESTIRKLAHGGGDSQDEYLSRLSNKILAANTIAKNLKKNGNVALIDGTEYKISADLLKKQKLIDKDFIQIEKPKYSKELSQLINDVSNELSGFKSNSNISILGDILTELTQINLKDVEYQIKKTERNVVLTETLQITREIQRYQTRELMKKISQKLITHSDYIFEAFLRDFNIPLINDILRLLLGRLIKSKMLNEEIMIWQNRFQDLSILVALSIHNDPVRYISQKNMLQNSFDFITNLFNRPTEDDKSWTKSQKSMATWTLEKRWYEM